MQRAYASRKNSSCFLLSQMPYSVPPPAPTRPPMSAPLPAPLPPLAMAPPAAPTAAPPSAPIPASLPTSTSLPVGSRPAPLRACACWLQESTTDWGGVLDWATRRGGVRRAGDGADGTRVLIMRLWPRGIRKSRVDLWLRELGPVIELLRAFRGGKVDWAEYRRLYRAGLRRPEAKAHIAEVRRLARSGTVTLLCG